VSQEVWMVAAGVAASLVTTLAVWIASRLGVTLSSAASAYLTYAVCLICAIAAKLVSGTGFPTGEIDVVAPALGIWFVEVLGTATLFYNTVTKKTTRLVARSTE